jgi:hypothetical protein
VSRAAQSLSHYEVELRREERTSTGWRAVRRVGPDGTMQPLRFATGQAANAHAARLSGRETRVVAVEHGGWCRTVDAEET